MRASIRLTLILAAGFGAAAADAQSAPRYGVVGSVAGPDGGWDYASVDPVTRGVYVARADGVTIVDPAAGTVRAIGSVARGHAAVPIPDFGLVLVTSGRDDSVRLIDPVSGVEKARIAVGGNPDAAFYDGAKHRAVVMNAESGTVSVIDIAAAKVVRTITLKPGLEFGVLGPPATLYVNNEDANEIETADLDTGEVGAPIALPGCIGPSGMALDARNHRLISACANGKAAVVDVSTRRLTGLLDIGGGPDAVILDVVRRIAFIPCGKDGVLEEIALDAPRGPRVIASIPTEIGARTGAVDPRSGVVYLPTARFGPIVAPATRPTALPGSFHVLIVSPSGK